MNTTEITTTSSIATLPKPVGYVCPCGFSSSKGGTCPVCGKKLIVRKSVVDKVYDGSLNLSDLVGE